MNEPVIETRYFGKKQNEKTVPYPIQVREILGTGKVLKRYQLPPIINGQNFEQPSFYPYAVLVPPGAEALFTTHRTVGNALGNETATRNWKMLNYEASMWQVFAMCVVFASLIYAAVAWRFGSRHQVSPKMRWTWAIAVFFSGFFGLLTLLVLREWLVQIACENCGKGRSVAQETCAHCDAAWPAPVLDGMEIFA